MMRSVEILPDGVTGTTDIAAPSAAFDPDQPLNETIMSMFVAATGSASEVETSASGSLGGASSSALELEVAAPSSDCCSNSEFACDAAPSNDHCAASWPDVKGGPLTTSECCGFWNMYTGRGARAVPIHGQMLTTLQHIRWHAVQWTRVALQRSETAKQQGAMADWSGSGRSAWPGMSNWQTRRWRAAWVAFFGNPQGAGPALDKLIGRLRNTLWQLENSQLIQTSRTTSGTMMKAKDGRKGQVKIRREMVAACHAYRSSHGWPYYCMLKDRAPALLVWIHEATHLDGTVDELPQDTRCWATRCYRQADIKAYVVESQPQSTGWRMDETRRDHLLNHAGAISAFIYNINGYFGDVLQYPYQEEVYDW